MTDLDDLKMNLLNWPNHPNNCGSAEGWMKKAHDRIEEQDKLLAAAADQLNIMPSMSAMDLGAAITRYRLEQQKAGS